MPKLPQPPQEYALGTVTVSDLAALRARLTDPNLRGLVLRGNELFATFASPPEAQEIADLIAEVLA